MTAVTRRVPCLDNGSTLPTDGQAWANQANKEIMELWNLASSTLVNVAGTNTITAQVSIAGVLTPLTAYQDGQEFVLIPANDVTGPATLNIDTLGGRNIVDRDGNALVSGALKAARAYRVRMISAVFRVLVDLSQFGTVALPKGFITPGGFVMSNDAGDTNNYIGVSPGVARDSTDTTNISFASAFVKRMNAAWVAGTNQGGILQSANLGGTVTVTNATATIAGSGTSFSTDYAVGDIFTTAGGQSRRITVVSSNIAMTVASNWSSTETAVAYKRGGKAPSTNYRVFLLRKDSDGTGDIAFGVRATPTDLPSGYSTYRRIGWVMVDSSTNNRQFTHVQDDMFNLSVLSTEVNTVVTNTAGGATTVTTTTTITSLAPPNVLARLVASATIAATTNGDYGSLWTIGSGIIASQGTVKIFSTAETVANIAPTILVSGPMSAYFDNTPTLHAYLCAGSAVGEKFVAVNSSGQYTWSASSFVFNTNTQNVTNTFTISLTGWRDTRATP